MRIAFTQLSEQLRILEREFDAHMKNDDPIAAYCVGLAAARLLRHEGDRLHENMQTYLQMTLDAKIHKVREKSAKL